MPLQAPRNVLLAVPAPALETRRRNRHLLHATAAKDIEHYEILTLVGLS